MVVIRYFDSKKEKQNSKKNKIIGKKTESFEKQTKKNWQICRF